MSRELRSKAIRLLARRERSRAELQQILDPEGNEGAVMVALLDELQQQGWLSDARLAEQVVNARRPRLGAARIRMELKRRGVSPDTLSEATQGLDAGDFAIASNLWQRRFGTNAVDRTERERQLRFLLARGFSRSVALKVLQNAGRPEPDDNQEDTDV